MNGGEAGDAGGEPVGGVALALAVLDGGPGDGREHMVRAETIAFRMNGDDGSRHLYERVPTERVLPDGRRAVIFRWRGRY
jgi:hypothetical protein